MAKKILRSAYLFPVRVIQEMLAIRKKNARYRKGLRLVEQILAEGDIMPEATKRRYVLRWGTDIGGGAICTPETKVTIPGGAVWGIDAIGLWAEVDENHKAMEEFSRSMSEAIERLNEAGKAGAVFGETLRKYTAMPAGEKSFEFAYNKGFDEGVRVGKEISKMS